VSWKHDGKEHRGWKKLLDVGESRKVGGRVPPYFWVCCGVLQKVVLLVEYIS